MGFSGQNTGVEEMCREQCSWVHCTQRTMLMGSLHKLFQINPRRMDHSNYGELFLHDFDFDLIGGIVGLFAIHPHSDLLSSSWKSLSLSAKHIKIQTSLSILKWKPKGSCAE
jgi:hypothetical protein